MSRKFLVPILLPADPVAPMEAATKQYVDNIDFPVDTGIQTIVTVAATTLTLNATYPTNLLQFTSAADATLTLPDSADSTWLTGQWCDVVRNNTGTLTVVAPAGVYLNGFGGSSVVLQRSDIAKLIKVGSTPPQWNLDVTAAGGGAGADEVFVGPNDPGTTGTYELWVDSDAVTPTSNPVAEIFYSEITASVNVTATTAATANTIINPGNVTYDGTPIMLEFYSYWAVTGNAAGCQLVFNLWDGNTDLGYHGQMVTPAAGATGVPVHLMRRLTPTPGAHNYNMRAWALGGGNVPTVNAGPGSGIGTSIPAFLRATRVLQGGGTIAPPQSGLDINKPAAAAKYAGLRYFATDTLVDWLCDGTKWITNTPTPWTPVTFLNGWVNYGGAFQTVQYRKIGDEVYIRGLAKSGTVNTPIFGLPAGFAPPATLNMVVESGGVFAGLTISSGGGVTCNSGNTNVSLAHSWSTVA